MVCPGTLFIGDNGIFLCIPMKIGFKFEHWPPARPPPPPCAGSGPPDTLFCTARRGAQWSTQQLKEFRRRRWRPWRGATWSRCGRSATPPRGGSCACASRSGMLTQGVGGTLSLAIP
jgi:hypothetical protein